MKKVLAVCLSLVMMCVSAIPLFSCGKKVVEPPHPEPPIDVVPDVETELAGIDIYPLPKSAKMVSGKFFTLSGDLYFDSHIETAAKNKILSVLNFYVPSKVATESEAKIKVKQNEKLNKEGYSLKINKDGVYIEYKDGAGCYYAAVTLNQILEQKGTKLPFIHIENDYPDLEMRGYAHDIARDRVPTLNTLKSLVSDLASMKINTLELFIDFPATIVIEGLESISKGYDVLTTQELRELNDYANENYVDIIPFFETMGHLDGILQFPQYTDLREVFTDTCSTICLQNPKAQTLIGTIMDSLMSCFDSEYFFMGGDESYEIGTGQSLEYLGSRKTVPEVYIDTMQIVYKMLDERGKKMLICHDMIDKYYDSSRKLFKTAFANMPNATVVLWQYEEDSTFVGVCNKLEKLGAKYIIMPSTDTFGSVAGRLSTAEKNLNTGVKVAIDKNTKGVITAHYGDGGTRNQLVVEYTALAYSAGLCWDYQKNYQKIEEYQRYVNLMIFKEKTGKLMESWVELQRYNEVTGRSWGLAWLVAIGNEAPFDGNDNQLRTYMSFQEGTGVTLYENCIAQMDEIMVLANNFLSTIADTTITLDSDRAEVLAAEMKGAAKMIIILAEYAKMRIQLYGGLKTSAELKNKATEMYHYCMAFNDEYRATWLLGNKQSLLENSIAWLNIPLYLFGNIGDVYKKQANGNCFLLTPNDIEKLDTKIMSKSFNWNSYGKGYPSISAAFGVFTYCDFEGMIQEGSISLQQNIQGANGKVFAINNDKLMDNYRYKLWTGDATKNTKFTPHFMWPAIMETNGVYVAEFRLKFKNGAPIKGNISFAGIATNSSGLHDLSEPIVHYSEPDKDGWVKVTYRYNNSKGYKWASIGVKPNENFKNDILYVADLNMYEQIA